MAHCLTGNNNIAMGQNALDALTHNGSFGGAHIAIGNQSMQNYVDTSPANAIRNTAVGGWPYRH